MLSEINMLVADPKSVSPHIANAKFDSETRCLTLTTKFPQQGNNATDEESVALLRFTEKFLSAGNLEDIAVIVGGAYNVSHTRGLKELAQWAVELCRESTQMFAMATALSDQWEHGMTFEITPNSIGTSLETSTPMHPQLKALINGVRENTKLTGANYVITDDPVTHRTSIAILYELTRLEPLTCEAWNLVKREPLELIFRFHRERFLDQSPEVWVGQRHHLVSLDYVGAAGQLKNIFERLLSTMAKESAQQESSIWVPAILESYEKVTSPGAFEKTIDANAANATAEPLKIIPTADFVSAILAYLDARIESLTETCVICDEKHQVSAHLTKSAVCTRATCIFKFQALNVGKNAAKSIGIHLLVLEALVSFTYAAIRSDRFENILTPFPEFLDEKGEIASHPTTCRDIVKLRMLADELKEIRKAVTGALKLSPKTNALVNWIVTSNTSFIKKLETPIEFMHSAHQFMFIQSTQKNAAAFEELKKTKKTTWAFHGSRKENWHSIIRNGLVNASGTALQVNGAAYGKGIYLSPHAAVSFGYSGMGGTGGPVPAKDSDEISKDYFCIAVCELIDEHINKSGGSIWVQPYETHVMTRFFFVFNPTNICGQEAVLGEEKYYSQLNKALKDNLPQ